MSYVFESILLFMA